MAWIIHLYNQLGNARSIYSSDNEFEVATDIPYVYISAGKPITYTLLGIAIIATIYFAVIISKTNKQS